MKNFDLEEIENEINISELPNEHFNKIKALAGQIWSKYPFAPYNGEHNYGRSLLEAQLSDLENYCIRDCKLPTFIAVELLNQLGYETQIMIQGAKGFHPYLLVHLKDYQDLVLLVSFHPENFVSTWLVRGLEKKVVRWGEDLEEYANNNGYRLIPTDDTGWEILNNNFLYAQEG